MDPAFYKITIHLLTAVLAGGAIGIERSFHGRPAGFRTHALVCLSSSLLMTVTVFQGSWLTVSNGTLYSTDPTRMAQGIMTGIGFLGAGVIFKEGLNVRGLTTAASIWITAGIGILLGIGFYFPAILATALTLIILSLFRWIEAKIPSHNFANSTIAFNREKVLTPELVESINAAAMEEANAAAVFADESPEPTFSDITKHIYWEEDNRSKKTTSSGTIIFE